MIYEVIERIKTGHTLLGICSELGVTYEVVCDAFYQYCKAMKSRPGWPSTQPRIQKVYFGHPKVQFTDEMDYGTKEWEPVAFNQLSNQEQHIFYTL